jgi:hypothetical protein
MIALVDIRRLVDRLTKKEQRGNIINGEDFNTFLRISQAEHFDSEKRKAEATSDIIDSLSAFIVTYTGATTGGTGLIAKSSLASPYAKLLSAQRLNTTDFVRCDIVSQLELEERLSNSLTVGTNKHPIVSIEDDNFRFSPSANKNIKIIYYKQPTDPVLDWYIDVNDNIVYLAAAEVHTWVTGETDSVGTEHTTGETDYTSLTTELEWSDNSDRITIAYRMLSKMGITIPNNMALEFGVSETMKSEVKQ